MLNNPGTSLHCKVCAALVCLGLLGYSTLAFAWGRDAHTAIGIMAVNQLQPDALRELESIVNPLTKQGMAEACSWPDDLRETGEGEWSGPLHYVNIPRGEAVYSAARDCPAHPDHMDFAERPAQHCVTEAIKYYAAGLSRPQASREQRWQAFAWLCHLVGDLHQPLHAGFADDRGGNDIGVIFKDEPMNLHHFWDTALISQRAGSWQYLVGELSEFPPIKAGSNWSPGTVNDWTGEAHKLARDSAYPASGAITEFFAAQSWGLTRQQIRLAASRLALILNAELQAVTHVERDETTANPAEPPATP